MRRTMLSAVPLLAALTVAPAGAQVSGRIHVDIPIGRPPVRVYQPQFRPVVIYDYSSSYFGDWDDYYWDWAPVTLYLYGGQYYERPFPNARPVVMYRFRDRFFAAPHDQRFALWDRQYGRASGHVFRDSRDFREFRDRSVRVDPRFDNRSRGGQIAPRPDTRGRGGQVAPRPDTRGRGGQAAPRPDSRGRGGQAPPSSGRGGRGGRPDSHGGGSRP